MGGVADSRCTYLHLIDLSQHAQLKCDVFSVLRSFEVLFATVSSISVASFSFLRDLLIGT
jgi:hypothetical protein